MEYIEYGNDLKLSRVVAGCMRINEAAIEGNELLEFVEQCLDMEISSFDHAPVYGMYSCEKIFGDYVVKANPDLRKRMRLITKTGIVLPGVKSNGTIYYDTSSNHIISEVEKSLNNLGTDYIDLLLLHRYDVLSNPLDTSLALEKLVKSGKVLSVGVSNYQPIQITALQSALSIPIVTNQIELSVQKTENFDNGIMDYAFYKKMFLMAWSPLGGGEIFNKDSSQSGRLRSVCTDIAHKYGVTLDVVMYAWLFTHPAKIAVITGTLRIERIKKAVNALEIKLTHDEWYRILEASRGYPVP